MGGEVDVAAKGGNEDVLVTLPRADGKSTS